MPVVLCNMSQGGRGASVEADAMDGTGSGAVAHSIDQASVRQRVRVQRWTETAQSREGVATPQWQLMNATTMVG